MLVLKLITDRGDDVPVVVLSFDFEMRWAFHDTYAIDPSRYLNNLKNSRPAVLAMLQLLKERNLRATWAAVGALGASCWDEYFALAPDPPKYTNASLRVRSIFSEIDPSGVLHFAPDLIERILEVPGQELGSHSFSHLYFREPGVTSQDFLADMEAVESLWKTRFSVIPRSLVFPRNQTAFTDILEFTSIQLYRGPELPWYYDCMTYRSNKKIPSLLRFVDGLNPFQKRSQPLNGRMIRSSLFIRFNLPERLWLLQLIVIRNELDSIQPGNIFHCWWHPHNVGPDLVTGIARFRQVFDLISNACYAGKVCSNNMNDLVR